MADTKNFGLKGVGNDIQLGKAGPRLNLSGSVIQARNAADGAFVIIRGLDPVGDSDLATKLYVDSVAAGLDPKESCQAATTSAGVGTYSAVGGTAGTGSFTSVGAAIDGVTLAQGDRVLVKDQAAPVQNGIYVVQSTTTTLFRADDQDGVPAANVSAGNYTFVEAGTVNANTGWVLQGDGVLTLNTDALDWVLFSSSGTIIAGNGLVKNGNALDLDFSELTSASVIALADELIFQDAGVESRITVTNFLNDRDIVTATANGVLVRTAADTYASRTITASAVAGDEGISIVNGDGVAGNPTIGIDIQGTTALAVPVATGDSVLMFDTSLGVNVEATVDQLKTFMNAGTSSTSITEGDTTVAVSDAGSGTVTTTIDGVVQITSIAASTTFDQNVIVSTSNTLTVADLTNNDVLIAGTGGLVEDSAGNLTFSGTQLGVTGSIVSSTLTDNRVLLAGAAGLIEDDANFTFDGTTMQITAAANITGDLDVDNININLNTISNTSTDADLILLPNGTGSIILQNGSGEEILELNDTVAAVNGLAITAGATGNPAQITTGTGSEANIDIGFLTNGTGVLSVVAGSGNYEDNVTADDDIPNKLYVDNAVIAAAVSGGLDSVSATVSLTAATTINIGAATGIPINATILSVTLRVNTASDAATTVTVGDVTNGAASYMAAAENDPETIGTYIADGYLLNITTAKQARATVATPGSVGSAVCIITFRHSGA